MSNKEIANQIAQKCADLGWDYSVDRDILTIHKRFEPESKDEFTKADMEYYSILGLLPSTRPGSVWGTDGGGMGALTALQYGLFEMKKSGGNKYVLRELKKMGEARTKSMAKSFSDNLESAGTLKARF